MDDQEHLLFMQRCISLARLGGVNVAPNPMVGAVLVQNNQIIAEGYHQQYGEAHAEVHCIQNALKNGFTDFQHTTLYVSLEPCAHFGKTPPCADLIIQYKIPKVVIGCRDIFAAVNGKGVARLHDAGIEVIENVLRDECIKLNKRFFTFHQFQRPYIILKWAQTNNGFIASANTQRLLISNAYTNHLVHKWRSEEAAIMIGSKTALHDNPLLDNRYWFGKPPVKILFDPHGKVPPTIPLFAGGEVIVFNYTREEIVKNVQYIQVGAEKVIEHIASILYQKQIQSVLVEGGRMMLQSFIDAGLWDEARIIVNKDKHIAAGLQAPVLSNENICCSETIVQDTITVYKNKNNLFLN